MRRTLPAILFLLLGAACGEDEPRPGGPGGVFGGSGGGVSDAAAGSGGDADAGTEVGAGGEAGTDAATDATEDGADVTEVQCLVDPAAVSGDGYCVVLDDNYLCNPVTGEACDLSANETCEFDGERFRCVDMGGSGSAPCGICGVPGTEYCAPGHTCQGLGDRCTRYCCDDFQCAFGSFCIKQAPTSVGICQATSDDLLSGFVGEPVDGGTTDSGGAPPACVLPPGPGDGSCIPAGDPAFPCNPVTNEGCDASANEACDFESGVGSFCLVGSHDAKVCETCSEGSCAGGHTCFDSPTCRRFCCSDAECGAATCQFPSTGEGPGVCGVSGDGGSSS